MKGETGWVQLELFGADRTKVRWALLVSGQWALCKLVADES